MKTTIDNLFLGGFSSCFATVFTNPLEVVKTRMQLQGELVRKGASIEPYKGVLQGLLQIKRYEGYLALQRGLAPALCYQFIFNSFRMGVYITAYEKGWTRKKDGNVSLLKSAFFGGVGGTVGKALASPFNMLRNQLQSASVKSIAVGYQHQHVGFIQAFMKTYKTHGVVGLFRGVQVTVPRGFIGSGSQIATTGWIKEFLRTNYSNLDAGLISIISGICGGTIAAIASNPIDVVSTRLYNQGVNEKGRGIYYEGIFDCYVKIFKIEGIRGFYKGFWPNYIRLGPHSVLVLLFFDQFKTFKNGTNEEKIRHLRKLQASE